MQIELTRYKIKNGKSRKVDEWMQFLKDNMADVLLTLENEKMYVESIFRETLSDGEYLYWYSIRGEGGQSVEEAENEIDKKHLEFWKECIDDSSIRKDLNMEISMIPERIRKSF